MLCKECQQQNDPDAKFCIFCGIQLVQSSPQQTPPEISDLRDRIHRIETLFIKYISKGSLTPEEISTFSSSLQESEAEVNTDTIKVEIQDQGVETRHISERLIPSQKELNALSKSAINLSESQANSNTSEIINSPKRSRINWERIFGLNWLAITGSLALILSLGLILFGTYSVLSPWVKYAIGLVSGLVLVILGDITKSKYEFWSNALIGVGVSIIYVVTYASFGIWHLYTPVLGLFLLGVTGVSGWYLAFRSNEMWIAILAILGVFISPLLIGMNSLDVNILVLLAYLIIMDLVILGMSIKKNWKVLNQISLWGSYIYLWYASSYLGLDDLLTYLIALVLVYLIFIAVTSVFQVIKKLEPNFSDLLLSLSNTTFFYFVCSFELASEYPIIFALTNIFLSITNGILALFITRINSQARSFGIVFFVKSAIFLCATIPIYFSGISTTIMWSLMGAGFVILGLETREVKWRIYSAVLLTLAVSKLALIDLWPRTTYATPALTMDNWIINDRSILTLILVSTIVITYYFYKRHGWILGLNLTPEINRRPPKIHGDNLLIVIISRILHSVETSFIKYESYRPIVLGILAAIIVLTSTLIHVALSPLDLPLKTFIIAAITSGYGTILVFISIRLSHSVFRALGTVLVPIGCLMGSILIILVSEFPNMLLSWVFWGYISTTALALANIALQRVYPMWSRVQESTIDTISTFAEKWLQEIYLHILPITTIIASAYELFYQFDRLADNSSNVVQLAFTLFLGLFSILIFTLTKFKLINYRYSFTFYRYISLFLFVIACFKLLTVDMLISNGALTSRLWNEFLWLQKDAFTPIINPYFLVGLSSLAMGLIQIRIITSSDFSTYAYHFGLANRAKSHILAICIGLISVIVLAIGSREIVVSFEQSSLDRPPILLSLFWLIFSLSVLWTGIRSHQRRLRLTGLALLAIPLLKVFAYDTWNTHPALGFLGLFVIGCLLLGTSFVYQRNKDKVKSFIYK